MYTVKQILAILGIVFLLYIAVAMQLVTITTVVVPENYTYEINCKDGTIEYINRTTLLVCGSGNPLAYPKKELVITYFS